MDWVLNGGGICPTSVSLLLNAFCGDNTQHFHALSVQKEKTMWLSTLFGLLKIVIMQQTMRFTMYNKKKRNIKQNPLTHNFLLCWTQSRTRAQPKSVQFVVVKPTYSYSHKQKTQLRAILRQSAFRHPPNRPAPPTQPPIRPAPPTLADAMKRHVCVKYCANKHCYNSYSSNSSLHLEKICHGNYKNGTLFISISSINIQFVTFFKLFLHICKL